MGSSRRSRRRSVFYGFCSSQPLIPRTTVLAHTQQRFILGPWFTRGVKGSQPVSQPVSRKYSAQVSGGPIKLEKEREKGKQTGGGVEIIKIRVLFLIHILRREEGRMTKEEEKEKQGM